MKFDFFEASVISAQLAGITSVFDAAYNDSDCQNFCQYLQNKIEVSKPGAEIEFNLTELEALHTLLNLAEALIASNQNKQKREDWLTIVKAVKSRIDGERLSLQNRTTLHLDPQQRIFEVAWRRVVKDRVEKEIRQISSHQNNEPNQIELGLTWEEAVCLSAGLRVAAINERIKASKILTEYIPNLNDQILVSTHPVKNGGIAKLLVDADDIDLLLLGLAELLKDQKAHKPFFNPNLKRITQLKQKLEKTKKFI